MQKICKIRSFFIDHYHILFESAALNHLRIQRINKHKDGSYALTVKFNSYSELKRYQQNARRCTVSISTAILFAIVAFFLGHFIQI